MFALLVSAIVALGGALLFLLVTGSSFEAMQGPPIAITVIGALILLYLLSHHSNESRSGRLPAIVALGAVAVIGAITTRVDPAPFIKNFFATVQTDGAIDVSSGAASAPASVRIRKMADGFIANAEVNGQLFQMLVDSGAATVVLRQTDAEKAGIDVAHMTFDTPLKTANGTSYLAPIRLKSVRVGQLTVDDIEALVAKPGTLNESLLGMSFLRRLTSYQVAGDFITLRQ
jgi:aspartyl protease family protein